MPRALVVGGTGPTGPYVVAGLLERGFEVAILHRGLHEIDEIPPEVEHIHTDPYDAEALAGVLEGRSFELAVLMYGRLRDLARLLVGRAGRVIAVGGVPQYLGYMDPGLLVPRGLPVPTGEDAPRIERREQLHKGYMIRVSEQALFEHHPDAALLRYPFAYGPRQLMPREWSVIRRARDGRPHIIVPDGGLQLDTFGYVENLAHAVLLAVDQPEASAGRAYNCGDEVTLSLRQLVESIARIMGHSWEIVSVPGEVARPALPLMMQPTSSHRVMDLTRLRSELGYRDAVPVQLALERTVDWWLAHPPEPGGVEEKLLLDPFDYEAEDRLVETQRQCLEMLRALEYPQPAGPTLGWFSNDAS